MADPGTIGAVLAGGRSRRFGSPKTLAELGGEPLIHRPLGALLEALGAAAVVCKPGTPLPPLPPGVEVWHDAEPAVHPLAGIVTALERAGGRRVAVLACDMPGATAGLVRRLAAAGEGTVVARTPAGLEPLAALYDPGAGAALRRALGERLALRRAVAALPHLEVEATPEEVANLNAPGDLRRGLKCDTDPPKPELGDT